MVQDPWGAALTVATVEAKNVATGSVSKAPSSAAGKYTLADLPPGVYDISVAVPAVRPFEKKGVTVAAGKAVEVNIKLQEGTQLCGLGDGAVTADQVGHQSLAARTVVARQHRGLPHRRVLQQRRLDLARLDAEAADLHLLVQAPQELEIAVGAPAHPVAGGI